MGRITPFHRRDLEARQEAHRREYRRIDLDKLARALKVPPNRRATFDDAMNVGIRWFHVTLIADDQERPARRAEALKVLAHDQWLVRAGASLAALDDAQRLELGLPAAEQAIATLRELSSIAKVRRRNYQRQDSRPTATGGQPRARKVFARYLREIAQQYRPEMTWVQILAWIADAGAAAGANFPSHKKHRGRFLRLLDLDRTGERKQRAEMAALAAEVTRLRGELPASDAYVQSEPLGQQHVAAVAEPQATCSGARVTRSERARQATVDVSIRRIATERVDMRLQGWQEKRLLDRWPLGTLTKDEQQASDDGMPELPDTWPWE